MFTTAEVELLACAAAAGSEIAVIALDAWAASLLKDTKNLLCPDCQAKQEESERSGKSKRGEKTKPKVKK